MLLPPGISAPPDATLIRVASTPGWATSLPPVPLGQGVSVTLSDAELLTALPELETRGYTFAGVGRCRVPRGRSTADLVVASAMAWLEPDWWDAVTGRAYAVHTLHHGPVLRVFGALVSQHLGVWEPATA